MEALGQFLVGQCGHDPVRVGALDGEHCVVVEVVVQCDVEALGVALESCEVFLVVCGVGDGEEVVGAELVGEQVVEHVFVLVAQD